MATNRNRVISIALAISLIGETIPVKAFDLKDMFDGYSNSTAAGSWSNPISGANYIYGGSYTFKFKRGNSYAPWIQAEAPSYKIGCNGISLKGGFLALLGLDDIQAQLQDAGAAFAWGIVMGLVYSLPGVATVFKYIREWATTIQKLLQNACNIGQALGRYASDAIGDTVATSGIVKTVTESEIGKGFAEAKKGLEGAAGKVDSIFRTIDRFAENPDEVINGSKNKDKAAALGSDIIKKATAGVTSLSGQFFSSVSSGGDSFAGVIKSSLSEVFDGRIDRAGITFNFPENKKTEILLTLAFFGDIGINQSGIENLAIYYDIDGDGKIKKESMKGAGVATTQGQGVYMPKDIAVIAPVVKDTKVAAKALMYGFGEALGACQNSSGDICKIPNYTVILAAFGNNVPRGSPEASDTGIASSIAPLKTTKNFILNGTPSGSSGIDLKWNGFYFESLRGITTLVDNIKNKTGSGASSINVPLLLPNIVKYANVIANIEKKSGGPTAYSNHLKEMVARNNAYFAAQALASMLEQSVLELLKSNHAPQSEIAIGSLMNFLKSVQDRKKEILAAIQDDKKYDIDIEKLATLFQKIETENKIESIKLIR